MNKDTLVGYLCKSVGGKHLSIHLATDQVDLLANTQSQDGYDYFHVFVDQGKVQSIIEETKDATSVIGESLGQDLGKDLFNVLDNDPAQTTIEVNSGKKFTVNKADIVPTPEGSYVAIPQPPTPFPDDSIPDPSDDPLYEFGEAIFEMDTLFNWASRIKPIMQGCDKKAMELWGKEAHTPFNAYGVEDLMRSLYKDSVTFVIGLAGDRYPNVPLNQEDILKHFWDAGEEFSVKTILEYLNVNYFAFAKVLSNKAIWEIAKKLRPWGTGNEGYRCHVDQAGFVKKKKLVCEVYNSYDSFHEPALRLSALEKMCAVVFDSVDPVTVEDYFWDYCPMPKGDEVFNKFKSAANCNITAFKWHKNGNLYIWLKTEAMATEVAKMLCDEKPPRLPGACTEKVIEPEGVVGESGV